MSSGGVSKPYKHSLSVVYGTRPEELTCKVQLRRCRDVSTPQTDLQNKESRREFEVIQKNRQQQQQQQQHCLLGLTLLLVPHSQLLVELRYDEERLPALTLLGFEDVSKDVVADVEDVFPSDVQQVTDDV